MSTFPLKIVTPDGLVFDAEASSITVKTVTGDVQILKGHAEYFSSLGCGRARLVDADGNERYASTSGGFISVEKGAVNIVFTTFEYAENIDVRRATIAKERAEALLKSAKDHATLKVAKAKLERAISRISVAEEYR